MNTFIILFIVFALVLFNIFIPVLTTNYNKLLNDISINKAHKDELIKTDKIIEKLTNNTKAINTLEPFTDDESILRRQRKIDINGCYEAKFERCENKYGERGYKVSTAISNNCLIPGNNLTDYDTAFAQLDNYLNNMPFIADSNDNTRRSKCVNKPSVKNGIALFGLCNRRELTERYCALKEQKAELADMNPGLEESDLERGLSNMELINGVCFPDTTINCSPVETTTTTS
jgi:predicted transcriptional regulator